MDLHHGEITHEVIGAFYEIYNEVGWGFAESVYASIMRMVLEDKGFSCDCERRLQVMHRGRCHGKFRADLVVADCVLVEFKACKQLIVAHEAQVLNYLRASGLEVGLLFNFGPRPEMRRLIWTRERRDLTVDG